MTWFTALQQNNTELQGIQTSPWLNTFPLYKGKGKSKVHPRTGHEGPS
jgi:hypothetical protein